MYKNEINNSDAIHEQKVQILLEKLEEDEHAIDMGAISGYKGYSKRYAITDKARVYSFIQGKFLKPQIGANGYYHHILTDSYGKSRNIELHILVAKAFVEGWKSGYEVSHLDDDNYNCNADNLIWESHRDNCNRGNRNKKIAAAHKKMVVCLDTGEVYDSAKDAAEITGVNRNSISQCCNGKYKRAGGMRWEFYGVA